ncbi:hypothetical protein DY000_02032391 [Brassica cretica]|uniref:Reverse transcriptase RNase H-like domain-containing protein n=1 Tax=Brassica cretica TaxID=69181 RepID=A0ABQ7DTF9_BRACR|nr:hypothetical protein DY000_02032391 [Brassica cretica]
MAMAAAVIVPLGLLFFISGLLVNLLQAICYVLVRPLSKNTYRKINRVLAETLWLELVWIVDWWAGVKIKVFTDNETFNRMVHMGEVCSVHKLKINLYKPEHYPKHTDITEAHLEETMTVMFLRKLEDAEHAINGIKVDEETGPKSGNETDNDDQAEAKGTEAVDLDADAQKRKKQATDEQGYEESCDDEKNEPSFTSGVDDLVMDNEDENTEVAYCGDPQVIWEELHNQLLNSAE